MRIVGLAELRQVFDADAILHVVEQALCAQAAGLVQSPPPGQLLFPEAPGDCHVKYGHRNGSASFAIKVATGFYANGARGLPVNNGLILTLDASTGVPIALLLDEGWLTAWRTAAATALAATRLAPADAGGFGVVGGGLQAALALEWVARLRPAWKRNIWARDASQAARLAETADARASADIETLIGESDVVITTTPSANPLFVADLARKGQLFVGVGADSPGKNELPPELFERAAFVAVDDVAQSLDHGDWGAAVRVGSADADQAVMLGDLLDDRKTVDWSNGEVGIVDLTGIAAEDMAIAALFAERLTSSAKEPAEIPA